jgi:hypothetical protein
MKIKKARLIFMLDEIGRDRVKILKCTDKTPAKKILKKNWKLVKDMIVDGYNFVRQI